MKRALAVVMTAILAAGMSISAFASEDLADKKIALLLPGSIDDQGWNATNNAGALAAEDDLIILCGHYEGIDQRVLDELGFEEISVGDYVVTGGELPALMLTDAVCRLQEGVLPNEDAYSKESHYNGLLEHPQYTRPDEWRGRRVPEVLLSGHHENIRKWQEEMSLKVTREKRPEMLERL